MALSSAPRHLLRRAPGLGLKSPLPVEASCRLATSRNSFHTRAREAISTPLARSPRRPKSQQYQSPMTVPGMSGKRTLFIQTENTPNPDALKFMPGSRVLPENFKSTFLEYLSARSTLAPPNPSPLAASLFNIDGVTAVFYGTEYITVTKDSSANWANVKPEIFALITETVTAGTPIVNTIEGSSEEGQAGAEQDSLMYDENDSEVVSMIKELLETRIRPAIQEDGGDIEFRGFNEGWVMLKLRGACRTCDSSTVTLRNGIESMLMHYIEEVKGVQQVLDPEEEVAMAEFSKFEERLRKAKGPDATASTGGKGTLDSAEA